MHVLCDILPVLLCICYYSTNILYIKKKSTHETIIVKDLALKKNSSKVNEVTIKIYTGIDFYSYSTCKYICDIAVFS